MVAFDSNCVQFRKNITSYVAYLIETPVCYKHNQNKIYFYLKFSRCQFRPDQVLFKYIENRTPRICKDKLILLLAVDNIGIYLFDRKKYLCPHWLNANQTV